MLFLSRQENGAIVLNNDIILTVVEIQGDHVRLSITAPSKTSIQCLEAKKDNDSGRTLGPPSASADEAAFRQAIQESPRDGDALLQIYADWLEERGDPRGAFIRLQSQLACMELQDRARKELEELQMKLWTLPGFTISFGDVEVGGAQRPTVPDS